SGRLSITFHGRSLPRRARWAAERRARPHSRLAPGWGDGTEVAAERHSAIPIFRAPAAARDFDVPRLRAPSAGILVDMAEVRPHQPTTYDIRGGRRPVRTFSSPSPSGSLTRPQSAKGEASMKMLTSISVGRKRF